MATTSLITTVTAKVQPIYTRPKGGVVQTDQRTFGSSPISFASGTGSGQCNIMYDDQRTLLASTSENLDLAGGSLEDSFGLALTFVKIKSIYVKAATGNLNNVIVGGGTNGFLGPFSDVSDKLVLPPGGIWQIVHPTTGWTVTAGTGDILKVENSGAGSAVIYDLVLIGTDA